MEALHIVQFDCQWERHIYTSETPC